MKKLELKCSNVLLFLHGIFWSTSLSDDYILVGGQNKQDIEQQHWPF